MVGGRRRPAGAPGDLLVDARAADVIAQWTAAGLLDEAFRRTGNRVFPGCGGPVLAWLDRNEPAVLDRAATAASCKDVVLQRLTGVRAADCSNPAVPFFDPYAREYATDLVAAAGLAHRGHLLPPVLPAPMGELRRATAGLPAGTKVVSAPYDLPAAAWGAGVSQVGLTVLPFFAEAGERAPFVAPGARARIDGLHTGVGRADIVPATCESIAYSARHCLTAAGLTGELAACGGGLRTRAWAQIFADVLARPIRLLGQAEVGARGAAQAALRAVGAAALPPAGGREVVRPAAAGGYDDRYAAYLDHVAQARATWRSTA